VSEERVNRILAAAYVCFARHGLRKTTMDDIATAAGMSRPAVYQYIRNKQDAFRRVATGIFDTALGEARAAAEADGTLTQRLDRVLAVKLDTTARLLRDNPYAIDLIRANADLDRAFAAALIGLLTATIADAATDADLRLGDGNAREVAELALALTRGLEVELLVDGTGTPDKPRERLRNGIALLVAGLAAATKPARA
jgi:TetR/AcrR family transcriptional regulator